MAPLGSRGRDPRSVEPPLIIMAETPPFRQGQEGVRGQPRDHPCQPKGLHSWYGWLDVGSLKGDLADPCSGRLVLRLWRWCCLVMLSRLHLGRRALRWRWLPRPQQLVLQNPGPAAAAACEPTGAAHRPQPPAPVPWPTRRVAPGLAIGTWAARDLVGCPPPRRHHCSLPPLDEEAGGSPTMELRGRRRADDGG